ncbi:MAG: hypothetical protein ACRDM1_06360 [Gaiellaceae bacterium]
MSLAAVSAPPSEWQYVAAAYLVVFVFVLLWVALIAAKLQRLQRQLAALVEQARGRRAAEQGAEEARPTTVSGPARG